MSPGGAGRAGGPRRRIAAVAVCLALIACGDVPSLEHLDPARSCRQVRTIGASAGPSAPDRLAGARSGPPAPVAAVHDSLPLPRPEPVRWVMPRAPDERRRLDAWCAAVGPALLGGWADPAVDPLDSVLVVAWNTHAGGGRLRDLVRDLRSGRITGRPEPHFVLLLQEVVRRGPVVPVHDPALPAGDAVARPSAGGASPDIVDDAEALRLSLVYVPSMRNGKAARPEQREDRGNAILATLPIHDAYAIELPVARQRRVAVAATVRGGTRRGASWGLQAATVHLENDAAGLGGDEAARRRQARALLAGLPAADLAVAGGDVNTGARGPREGAVSILLDAYPDTPPFPSGPTYRRAFGLFRLYLDYQFFRLPEGAVARYRRLDDSYGSDHDPLVGWIVFDRDA